VIGALAQCERALVTKRMRDGRKALTSASN
jgi:hypothetical protein